MCKFKFSLIMYASKMLRCLFYWIFYIPFLVRARNSATSRFINLNGCDFLSTLEYECCASVNIANSPQNQYCLSFEALPNQLTLNLDFKLNGETFYKGKIDPSLAPICPTPVPLCLTINHVDVSSSQICSKLTFGPLTLVKFPCVGITDGQIVTQDNDFARK